MLSETELALEKTGLSTKHRVKAYICLLRFMFPDKG